MHIAGSRNSYGVSRKYHAKEPRPQRRMGRSTRRVIGKAHSDFPGAPLILSSLYRVAYRMVPEVLVPNACGTVPLGSSPGGRSVRGWSPAGAATPLGLPVGVRFESGVVVVWPGAAMVPVAPRAGCGSVPVAPT